MAIINGNGISTIDIYSNNTKVSNTSDRKDKLIFNY